jgi:hypothetical protein
MNVPEQDPAGFERRLASWLPAATALDRDRMLFEAGRASARAESRRKVWPAAASGLALLLLGLGGLFARERSRRLALETVLAARPPAQAPVLAVTPPRVALPSPSVERPGPSSYLVLTTRLAAGELDFPSVSRESNTERPPGRTGPPPRPLRPRGFERVLDL